MEIGSLSTTELPKREVKAPHSLRRLIVDITFGIIAPIFCLILDPGFFTGHSMLTRWRVFAYATIALCIVVLAIWLWRRFRLGSGSGFVAGVLFAGALCSFLIGVIMFPATLFGLLFIIGIFGFIPFLTAFVFFRNARQALNYANKHLNVTGISGSFILGIFTSIAIPALIQLGANAYVSDGIRDLMELVQQENADWQPGVSHLKTAFWCTTECFDDLLAAYEREADPARRERFAYAYNALTRVILSIN
jgi:hypothetical protein